MANAIRQRIALDGSEDVKRQLNDLGNTGQEAFKKIADASNQVASASGAAGDGALSLGEKALAAAGLIGVLATAAFKLGKAFVGAAEDAAKNANAIANAATRSGQSLQAYQEQIAVLRKLGLSEAEAEQSVKRFGAASTEAYTKGTEKLKGMGAVFPDTAAGLAAQNDQLARMGQVIRSIPDAKDVVSNLNNAIAASKGIFDKTTGAITTDIDALQRFVDEVKKIQDPLVRSKVLTQLFGEELGRLFNEKVVQGKTPLSEFLAEFKNEGGALSAEQKKVAADFQKAFDDLARIRANANRDQGLKFAELLTPIVQELNRVIPIVNAEIDKLIAEASKPLKGESLLEAVVAEAGKVKDAFLSVFASIGTEAQSVFSAIGQTISGIFAGIWNGIAAGASSMWQQIQQDAQTTVNFIVSLWDRVIEAIRRAGDASNIPGTAGGGAVPGFAGGGVIRGRGTGTSDSILALVSNGEGILTARALRHYGPGIVAAINSLRFPRFSVGGIVDGLQASMSRNFALPGLPRFADGGVVGGSMNNVTIQFPGLPEIVGLRASSGVVDELRKAAAMAQVRSGGRKPSRYG